MTLRELLDGLPAWAKDLRLNLLSVLEDEGLTAVQRTGAAFASALAEGEPRLAAALEAEAHAAGGEPLVEEARAVAAIMSMNNVLYRSRHWLGEESLRGVPARMRMQRLGAPRIDRRDQELLATAVSALNGCERCVTAHSQVLVQGGLDLARVHDAVRIAAAVRGAAVALRSAAKGETR